MIGGCALNHSLEKVRARGKGPCTKVWDVCARFVTEVEINSDGSHNHVVSPNGKLNPVWSYAKYHKL